MKIQTIKDGGQEDARLRENDFTQVIKDAPVSESEMETLKGDRLHGETLLAREQQLAKIRDHGFAIPISPVLRAVQSQLHFPR